MQDNQEIIYVSFVRRKSMADYLEGILSSSKPTNAAWSIY